MCRANQGFLASISQSANTSRGILPRRKLGLGAVGKDGRRRRAVRGRLGLVRVEDDDLFLPFARGLEPDLGEEDGHARPALLRPTLRPHAHERQGDRLRDGRRLLALQGPEEVDLRRTEIAAAGGEQLPDEPVVGHVLLERGPNPAVVRLGAVGPEVDREFGLDPQQVAPLHRPVVGELRPLEQAVDQHGTLVGGLVVQKALRLLGRGQRADGVEIDPPEENRIGTQVGRLDFQLLQLGEHQLVDLALRSQGRRDFEGIRLLQRIRRTLPCRAEPESSSGLGVFGAGGPGFWSSRTAKVRWSLSGCGPAASTLTITRYVPGLCVSAVGQQNSPVFLIDRRLGRGIA